MDLRAFRCKYLFFQRWVQVTWRISRSDRQTGQACKIGRNPHNDDVRKCQPSQIRELEDLLRRKARCLGLTLTLRLQLIPALNDNLSLAVRNFITYPSNQSLPCGGKLGRCFPKRRALSWISLQWTDFAYVLNSIPYRVALKFNGNHLRLVVWIKLEFLIDSFIRAPLSVSTIE